MLTVIHRAVTCASCLPAGFAFSLIGEALTGQGALAQFGVETGIPLQDTEFGLLALISFFLLAAVNEGTGRFVDEENN